MLSGIEKYITRLQVVYYMSSPLSSPVIRYGYACMSAAIIAVIAFTVLDGTIRWVALGIAVIDFVVTPQVLKRVAEAPDEVA
jgi:hypothetical protein